MIPRAHLTAWRAKAPWPLDEQVEQDLVLSRALCEVNTREHFSVEGLQHVSFGVSNPWFSADTHITTYTLEELLGTKVRALYQRRKVRGLYDLWLALSTLAPDEERVVVFFNRYLELGGLRVSRAEFESNMAQKLASVDFRNDVAPLLGAGATYDVDEASDIVHDRLLVRLAGEPWKGTR